MKLNKDRRVEVYLEVQVTTEALTTPHVSLNNRPELTPVKPEVTLEKSIWFSKYRSLECR